MMKLMELQITQETYNQKSIDELLKAMNQFSDVINISRRGEFKTELSILNQNEKNESMKLLNVVIMLDI